MKRATKLRTLLDTHVPGTVCVASWLEAHGISRDLQKHYRSSGWLETVGTGAFKRPGEQVTWQGGLYALQFQVGLAVHVGALTALALQGLAHYVRLGTETVFLFSPPRENLPSWFRRREWSQPIYHCRTSVLPAALALVDYPVGPFSIRVAAPERAILESLHLGPDTVDLLECYQIVEGLTTLRPRLLQQLLEQCSSVKVKRLFLYMAEKAGHQWFKRLDTERLDLGSGVRTVTKGGVYLSGGNLILPKELVDA